MGGQANPGMGPSGSGFQPSVPGDNFNTPSPYSGSADPAANNYGLDPTSTGPGAPAPATPGYNFIPDDQNVPRDPYDTGLTNQDLTQLGQPTPPPRMFNPTPTLPGEKRFNERVPSSWTA